MTTLDYLFFWLGCAAAVSFPLLYGILFRPFRNWVGRFVMLLSVEVVFAYLKGALTILFFGQTLTVNLPTLLLNIVGAVTLTLGCVLLVRLKLAEDEDS
jgi:hypothetical protein